MEEGDHKGEEKRDFSYFFVKFRSFSQAPKKQNYIFFIFFRKIFHFFTKPRLTLLCASLKKDKRESLFLDFQRESTRAIISEQHFGTSFSLLSLVIINCRFLTRSTYSFSFLVLLFVRNFDLGRV